MSIAERLFGVRGTIFIRLAVGLIFVTQGILKYIDPHMGVERFRGLDFPILLLQHTWWECLKSFADSWCWLDFL